MVEPGLRPSAVEWHATLGNYAARLVTCKDNPLHQYDKKNVTCPYCDADRKFGQALQEAKLRPGPLRQTTYASPPKVAAAQTAAPNPSQAVNQAQPIVSAPQSSSLPKAGDQIQFGAHSWRVLDVQGNHALIVTENIIGNRMYHTGHLGVTWEKCEMRKYLNGEFLDAFSDYDKARIRRTSVANNDNPWFRTNGGNKTEDSVFLLSIEEVVWYFGDSGQMHKRPSSKDWWITDRYDKARIAHESVGVNRASWWWLRSPGGDSGRASYIDTGGSLRLFGNDVIWSRGVGGGVRPALWLELAVKP